MKRLPALLLPLLILFSSQSLAQNLVDTVINQLGVSQQQAAGGLGSLFSAVSDTVSSGDFSTLANSIPSMDELLAAVPEINEASGGMLSGLADRVASTSQAGELFNTLQKQFSALGLSPDMIGQFAEVAQSYLSGSGNSDAMAILQQGLGSIL